MVLQRSIGDQVCIHGVLHSVLVSFIFGSLSLYPTPQALLVFSQRKGLAHLSKTASVVRRLAAAYNDCESSPVIAAYREALAGGGGDPVGKCDVIDDVSKCRGRVECKLHSWGERGSLPPSSCTIVPSNVTTCEAEEGGWDEEVMQLIKEDSSEKIQSSSLKIVWDLHDRPSTVAGLACGSNRSLTVLLADSELHGTLLGALGLPEHWEGGVIVSPGREAVAPGEDGVLSEDHLESLVARWHQQGEAIGKPGLRSSEEGGCASKGLEHSTSCIPQLNSASFQSMVGGKSPTGAVVFYTSKFCAHCTTASYVVHTVQQLLEPLGDLGLIFYTIDATINDLPVHLTALSYPTVSGHHQYAIDLLTPNQVLVFPPHKKAESRVFPVKEEFNTTNLLTFIVSNLTPR